MNKFIETLDNMALKNNDDCTTINNSKSPKVKYTSITKSINRNFDTHFNYLNSDYSYKKLMYDPNLFYYDIPQFPFYFHNPSHKHHKSNNLPTSHKQTNSLLLKKKSMFINEPVTTIQDLLNIIEKFPYEPLIEYNINLKSLHNIKEPLIALNNMVGMDHLKENIVEQLLYFLQEFHKSSSKFEGEFMHTIIFGTPGTGKTEIAKIMGAIYSHLGILKKGTFKKVTRSDLVAGYLGQTAIKTKEVIQSSLGGVLFIDEAYALGNAEKLDSFSKECIDTLCEALSDHKHELMVIIAGYEKELEKCFFHYNQGLQSRFVWRFKTDKYTSEHLYKIFLKKVGEIKWKMEETQLKDLKEWFSMNMSKFTSYGRDIETFLSKVKIAHSKRVFLLEVSSKKIIIMDDIRNGYKVYWDNKFKESDIKEEIYKSFYC